MGVNYSKISRFKDKIFAIKKNQLLMEKCYNSHCNTKHSSILDQSNCEKIFEKYFFVLEKLALTYALSEEIQCLHFSDFFLKLRGYFELVLEKKCMVNNN